MATALENFASAFQPAYDSQLKAGAQAANLRLEEQANAEKRRASLARERQLDIQLADNLKNSESARATQALQQRILGVTATNDETLAPARRNIIQAQAEKSLREWSADKAADAVRKGASMADAVRANPLANPADVEAAGILQASRYASLGNLKAANDVASLFGGSARFSIDSNSNRVLIERTNEVGEWSKPNLLDMTPGTTNPRGIPTVGPNGQLGDYNAEGFPNSRGPTGVLRKVGADGNIIYSDPIVVPGVPAPLPAPDPAAAALLLREKSLLESRYPAPGTVSNAASPPLVQVPAVIPDGANRLAGVAPVAAPAVASYSLEGRNRSLPAVPVSVPITLESLDAELAGVERDVEKVAVPGMFTNEAASRVYSRYDALTAQRNELLALERNRTAPRPPAFSAAASPLGQAFAAQRAADIAEADREARTLSRDYTKGF